LKDLVCEEDGPAVEGAVNDEDGECLFRSSSSVVRNRAQLHVKNSVPIQHTTKQLGSVSVEDPGDRQVEDVAGDDSLVYQSTRVICPWRGISTNGLLLPSFSSICIFTSPCSAHTLQPTNSLLEFIPAASAAAWRGGVNTSKR
jgi:hypothetical protein